MISVTVPAVVLALSADVVWADDDSNGGKKTKSKKSKTTKDKKSKKAKSSDKGAAKGASKRSKKASKPNKKAKSGGKASSTSKASDTSVSRNAASPNSTPKVRKAVTGNASKKTSASAQPNAADKKPSSQTTSKPAQTTPSMAVKAVEKTNVPKRKRTVSKNAPMDPGAQSANDRKVVDKVTKADGERTAKNVANAASASPDLPKMDNVSNLLRGLAALGHGDGQSLEVVTRDQVVQMANYRDAMAHAREVNSHADYAMAALVDVERPILQAKDLAVAFEVVQADLLVLNTSIDQAQRVNAEFNGSNATLENTLAKLENRRAAKLFELEGLHEIERLSQRYDAIHDRAHGLRERADGLLSDAEKILAGMTDDALNPGLRLGLIEVLGLSLTMSANTEAPQEF